MPLTYKQLQKYLEDYPDEIEVVQAFEALGSEKRKPRNSVITGSAWIIRPSDHSVMLLNNALNPQWPLPQGELQSLYNTTEFITTTTKIQTRIESDIKPINNQIFHLSVQYQPTQDDVKHHYCFDICMLYFLQEPIKKICEKTTFTWHNSAELYLQTKNKTLNRLAKKCQWMSHQIVESV